MKHNTYRESAGSPIPRLKRGTGVGLVAQRNGGTTLLPACGHCGHQRYATCGCTKPTASGGTQPKQNVKG